MTRRTIILGILLLSMVMSQQVFAQGDDASCTPLIEERFTTIQQQCSALESDTVCFGSDIVEAAGAGSGEVIEPGTRADLSNLQSLRTAALDPELAQWGTAVINAQADIPMSQEGPALTFILLGDVMVENMVAPEEAIKMAEPVMVTTLVATNIRSIPSTNGNVISSAPAGTQIPADALSGDQEWIRVLYEGRVGWMSRNLAVGESALDAMPVMGSDSRALMQEFVFTTGSGLAGCEGAFPDLLVIQGPRNVSVDLVANGAPISLGSTIALWRTQDNAMRVMVLSGAAQVGNLSLPSGFTTQAQLAEDGRSVIGSWQNVRPMTPGERSILQRLEALPEDVINYAIILPTENEVQQTLIALTSSGPGAQSGPAGDPASCERFQPTSPLAGMGLGLETFYWDGATGANNYRVNIYNESGAQVGTFATGSANTTLTVNTTPESIGDGFNFSWEVEALVDNVVACTSARIPVVRDATARPVGGGEDIGGGDGEWPD